MVDLRLFIDIDIMDIDIPTVSLTALLENLTDDAIA